MDNYINFATFSLIDLTPLLYSDASKSQNLISLLFIKLNLKEVQPHWRRFVQSTAISSTCLLCRQSKDSKPTSTSSRTTNVKLFKQTCTICSPTQGKCWVRSVGVSWHNKQGEDSRVQHDAGRTIAETERSSTNLRRLQSISQSVPGPYSAFSTSHQIGLRTSIKS